MSESQQPQALHPGQVPESELTEEQRRGLSYLRGRDRQILERF